MFLTWIDSICGISPPYPYPIPTHPMLSKYFSTLVHRAKCFVGIPHSPLIENVANYVNNKFNHLCLGRTNDGFLISVHFGSALFPQYSLGPYDLDAFPSIQAGSKARCLFSSRPAKVWCTVKLRNMHCLDSLMAMCLFSPSQVDTDSLIQKCKLPRQKPDSQQDPNSHLQDKVELNIFPATSVDRICHLG